MTEPQLRAEMVHIGASLFARGYATGSAGNLSLRLPDGNLLATPTGSCLGELEPDNLSVITPQGGWISGARPSKEVAFHRAIYLNNPTCQAVVHLHCHFLTALSCLEDLDTQNCLRPFTPYVVMRVGEVPVVPYYLPGDEQIARDLEQLAPRYRAFLLANHGPVVTGNSLREATNNLEELEESARLLFTLGERSIRYLTPAEIDRLRE